MKIKCKDCKTLLQKNQRILKTKIFNIKYGKTLILTAFTECCFKCAKKRLKNWYLKHNIIYNNKFKKEFWIDLYPEHRDFILEKDEGKGTLQHYLLINKTKDDYYNKNKNLSVGENTLRKNGHNEEEIRNIKLRHSEYSKNNIDGFIRRYGIIDGEKRYQERCKHGKESSIWSIQYWKLQGYTDKQCKEIVSKIQNRGTLDYFTNKYGQTLGYQRYKEVNRKKYEGFKKNNYSMIEVDFFKTVVDKFNLSNKTIYYGDNQYIIGLRKNDELFKKYKAMFLDFFILEDNKIIEFHGDYFHANPTKYKENDIILNRTAKEIWNADKERKEYLINKGYKYYVVWEYDWRHNSSDVLCNVFKFLEDNSESNNNTKEN